MAFASGLLATWLYLNSGNSAMLERTRMLFEEPRAVKVTVYNNGMSTGGVKMLVAPHQFPSDGKGFAEYVSQHIKVDVHGNEVDDDDHVVVADRVFTGTGTLVQHFSDLHDGDRLYVVAPGLLFVWPFVELGHKVHIMAQDSPTGKPLILESFTDSPRTFHVHNFFSAEEAHTLIDRVLEIDDEDSKLQQSHVGHRSGHKQVSKKRTSENAFDQVSPTAIRVRQRAFELLNLPAYQDDMCDGLQLLRYRQKQAYTPHTDYFSLTTSENFNWDPAKNGSNRFATVFLYLSDVTKGGQTVFPKADMPENVREEYKHPSSEDKLVTDALIDDLFDKDSWEHEMAHQCKTKLAVYPKKGHAILFYSQKGNGEMDPLSLHGGCPNLSDENDPKGSTKWAANLWVWNRRRYGIDPVEAGKPISASISVNFENPTDMTVDVYWSSTKMVSIKPKDSINYKSFDGHKWSFKHGETVLLEFTVDKDAGSYQTVVVPEANRKEEL